MPFVLPAQKTTVSVTLETQPSRGTTTPRGAADTAERNAAVEKEQRVNPKTSKEGIAVLLHPERKKESIGDGKAVLHTMISPCAAIEGAVGKSFWVMLTLECARQAFLLDSGSQVTIVKELKGAKVEPTTRELITASGDSLPVEGVALVKLQLGELEVEHPVLVSAACSSNVLGTDLMVKLDAVVHLPKRMLYLKGHAEQILDDQELVAISSCNVKVQQPQYTLPENVSASVALLPEEYRETAIQHLNAYADIFREKPLGESQRFQHKIELLDQRPVKHPPRRVPPHKEEAYATEMKKMLEAQVIRPSRSAYASPVVLTGKKDGSTRFCIDYRDLNARTKQDAFPLPHVQDILNRMHGSKWFSTLDLQSGFWQVKMDPNSEEYTAFVTPNGHWQWNRMPFGLKNATATFQRMMTEVLAPILHQGCEVFVDDIMLFAKTIPELLDLQERTFALIRAEGLTLKAAKCKLFRQEVEVLGHIISAEGKAPEPTKLKAIENWMEPTSKKQVRSFLGLCNYYKSHIKDFAAVAAPLNRLTSKKATWRWTEEEQEAFEQLKVLLSQAPVLSLYNSKGKILVDCDASNYAIGAVLSQVGDDGEEHPLEFFSRCMTKAECNYCTTRRELLALIEALRHWKHYCMGGPEILVRTDHASLKWLQSFKSPQAQLARWIEELSMYNIQIEHRPGSQSSNADALSRRPCPPECAYCTRREEQEEEASVRQIQVQSAVDWSQEQDKDQEIVMVKQWINQGRRPPWEEVATESRALRAYWKDFGALELRAGVLCRKYYLPQSEHVQVIVPEELRGDICTQVHEQGHFGQQRTQAAIQARYYWPQWRTDVKRTVSQCIPCNQRKGPQQRARMPCKKYIPGEPWQRIAIDMLGPLPLTERGNRYVLVCSDYFTKWIECIAVPNQEAVTVAEALVRDVFSRWTASRTTFGPRCEL